MHLFAFFHFPTVCRKLPYVHPITHFNFGVLLLAGASEISLDPSNWTRRSAAQQPFKSQSLALFWLYSFVSHPIISSRNAPRSSSNSRPMHSHMHTPTPYYDGNTFIGDISMDQAPQDAPSLKVKGSSQILPSHLATLFPIGGNSWYASSLAR
jgi:hypothetical protein